MSLSHTRRLKLEQLCLSFRQDLIRLLYQVQTGHPGGSLSAVELTTTLYQEKMRISSPDDPNRDRFVLSKGHAAPILYLNLAQKGFLPKETLPSLRQCGSLLQGHPCFHKTTGVDVSTGPLGLGLSVGLGLALSARLEQKSYTTYVLLGDGELQEGCVWEAAMSAFKFQPGKLIALVDHNGVQLDGTNEEIMPMGSLADKFSAFGWHVLACDGHDVSSIADAVDAAKTIAQAPVAILAETVKGKGVSFMEGQSAWHGKPLSEQDFQNAMAELGGALCD